MPEIEGLYVIIDPAACRGRNAVEVAGAALDGGASILQWRDKLRDKGEQLAEALAVYRLCRERNALFFVNDHADLALAIGEPDDDRLGVHVGQKDLPVAVIRRILPDSYLIGASTNSAREAALAEASGASYVAVGDLFGTGSKSGTRPASLRVLEEVRQAVELPVIGIGGINAENARQVMAAGARGVAVISAVCGADDPRAAAAALVRAIAPSKQPE